MTFGSVFIAPRPALHLSRTTTIKDMPDRPIVRRMSAMSKALAICVTAVALAGCGGSHDDASAIAAQIGDGAICSPTGYGIVSRLNNRKAPIYDCRTDSRGEICVTRDDGVVNDVTAQVKLLFATTIGTGAPSCAT